MKDNAHENYISCYILDDETNAIDRLEILINKINIMNVVGHETNPDRAIESIVQIKPEIVFLDIVMGGKTGFEVVEEIRKHGENPGFIFVTAHVNYSIRAIKASAFDYLMKPVDIDELKETIRRYESIRPVKSCSYTDDFPRFECLSSREIEIIKHLVNGKTSQEIAKILCLSKNTIDTHRRNILEKTGLKSTNELIRMYFAYYR
jgi:DNA-binding NarL/FixJ family response regulator